MRYPLAFLLLPLSTLAILSACKIDLSLSFEPTRPTHPPTTTITPADLPRTPTPVLDPELLAYATTPANYRARPRETSIGTPTPYAEALRPTRRPNLRCGSIRWAYADTPPGPNHPFIYLPHRPYPIRHAANPATSPCATYNCSDVSRVPLYTCFTRERACELSPNPSTQPACDPASPLTTARSPR